MKAIVIRNYGGPEVLSYEDAADPLPGAGEILIEQMIMGVNFADVMMREGKYFIKPELPAVPGLEGAGTVIAIGEGVEDISVGSRVAYVMSLGGYAEKNVIPAANAVPLPETISDEVAGSSLLRGMTAHYLVTSTYGVSKTDIVLVQSAAGGVGTLLVQWAKHLGAKVIGTVSSSEKADLARRLGCDHVVNYTTENFAKEVLEITEGKGVSVVYDAVGQATFNGNIEALGVRGYFVNYGAASGPLPPIDAGQINSKSLFFNKSSLPHYMATSEERIGRAQAFFDLISQGTLHPEISHVYPLEEAAQAHIDMSSRKTAGSVALKI